MDNRRMYYFDGKNVMDYQAHPNVDHGLQSKKFDQNFDEYNASDVFKRSNTNSGGHLKQTNQKYSYNSPQGAMSPQNNLLSKQFNNTAGSNASYSNLNNCMLSGEYQDQFHVEENMKSQSYIGNKNNQNFYSNSHININQSNIMPNNNSFNYSGENFQNSQNFQNYPNYQTGDQMQATNYMSPNNAYPQQEPCILPENLISALKDQYYKTKGYIENKPDILMDFIVDYKNFSKKGMRVPAKVAPFLPINNEDIYNSLLFYHNQFIMSANQYKTGTAMQTNSSSKFKTKFTAETLKRLYPGVKSDEEMQKLKSTQNSPEIVEKFIQKLIKEYFNHNREYTNDENLLFEFWRSLNQEIKEKNSLLWTKHENDLVQDLTKYFDQEQILSRLMKIFKNVCGYDCYHPRPLHDYWFKGIPNEEKFLRGINKFDSETLYKLLEENYQIKKETDKKFDDEKMKIAEMEEKSKSKKNKVSKDQFDKIKKKFDILARPKDKWRTGRAMINLRKQFQYDNIIRKMIKYEFENNRVFRYPEEYALYDTENMRKTLFKNSLEKKIKKEKDDDIRELIQKTKEEDESKKRGEDYQMSQILKEDLLLEKFIKKMCIKYHHLAERRLINETNMSVNHFLINMYQNMLKQHNKATKRRFPKGKDYGKVKKSRFNNYPKNLKFYFFTLYRRLGKSEDGKFVFANYDNMPFWAPSLSNKCKVHKNNCPLYCKNNTHNEVITVQRSKNFNILYGLENNKLDDDERLHLWKRKDENLKDLKSKIFLCLNEVEHCTFEPKINKKEDDLRLMSPEDIINKRISNKVWVNKMGGNFSERFPLVYKEGVCKKVQKIFNEGRYTETLKELEEAFELDPIRAHFDKKFALQYKKRIEEERKNDNSTENKNDPNNLKALLDQHNNDKKKKVERDDFNNPKNFQICQAVYNMLKVIDDFRKNKVKAAKKIKEELQIFEQAKNEKNLKVENSQVVSMSMLSTNNQTKTEIKSKLSSDTIHKINFIKDRYFKFFKTMMCPLKNECPYDVRPRWPHSDLKANTPFGQGCPYAHHISELKFEQEVKEKIKLKKNYLKELEKEEDPVIINEWVPTGPIVSCNGCGKTFSDKSKGGSERVGAAGGPKGLCGYCRYHQKNEKDLKNDKIQADIANKKILERINYGVKKAEDWDQDYVAKFGMLKKATVLHSFKRYTDSLAIMEKLKERVESEQKENEERFVSLDRKWRAKLQILDFEIPKEILNYEISQEVLDHFKIKVPLATLLVYIEKMRKGNCFSIYNRHTYLNNQILQFFATVTKSLDHYKVDIKMLKTQLSELNIWNEKKERLKTENPKLYDKFYKKYRAEMCPNIINGKKCTESYRDCKFAHNPNQLNLTVVSTTKKLLNNTLNETQNKMKKSSTLVPWKYPKQKILEKGLKFDKNMVKKNHEEDVLRRTASGPKLRSKSEKRSRSIDIKKLRIAHHEI